MVLPGGLKASGKGQGQGHKPERDEAEEVRGSGKAEVLNGGAVGPERDQSRAGHALPMVAAPRHQAEEQRGKGVAWVGVLGLEVRRGLGAEVEEAAGEAGAHQRWLVGYEVEAEGEAEAEAEAPSLVLENL